VRACGGAADSRGLTRSYANLRVLTQTCAFLRVLPCSCAFLRVLARPIWPNRLRQKELRILAAAARGFSRAPRQNIATLAPKSGAHDPCRSRRQGRRMNLSISISSAPHRVETVYDNYRTRRGNSKNKITDRGEVEVRRWEVEDERSKFEVRSSKNGGRRSEVEVRSSKGAGRRAKAVGRGSGGTIPDRGGNRWRRAPRKGPQPRQGWNHQSSGVRLGGRVAGPRFSGGQPGVPPHRLAAPLRGQTETRGWAFPWTPPEGGACYTT
jgi:hypothetical protein